MAYTTVKYGKMHAPQRYTQRSVSIILTRENAGARIVMVLAHLTQITNTVDVGDKYITAVLARQESTGQPYQRR